MSWRIRYKTFSLWSKYHLRLVIKRSMGLFPFLLFLLSVVLFAVVLLPNFGQRLRDSSLLSFGALTLQIVGVVSEEVRNASGMVTLRPVSGALIECGGFRATSNLAGLYDLKFRSQRAQDIPIIVRRGSREISDRVSFPPGEYRIQKDFTLNELPRSKLRGIQRH